MMDKSLEKMVCDAQNKLMEINEFSIQMFGLTTKRIVFHVTEGLPLKPGIDVFVNSTDVIELLSRMSLSHKVNDIDVSGTAGRFLMTIRIDDTKDYTTNIDIDFLGQIKNIIDSIEGCDNGGQ